jgi:hypothetical protein
MTGTAQHDILIAEVKSYADLKPNWDTYGGKPACEGAVAFAVELLEQLKSHDAVPVPRVLPISTGVMLNFTDDCYLEVDEEGVLRWGVSQEGEPFDVTAAVEALTERWV